MGRPDAAATATGSSIADTSRFPPLTTSKGELVNGVFGFASIVLRGIQDLQPDYLAVSFDLPGPTFRHEQYADYKATRVKMPDDLRDQFPKVREVVKALRIPVYEMAGFEADDVIGTITRQLDDRDDLETTIVTVDLDMLQLVTPRVRLMTTRSGVENTVMYDVARIDERFGLRPDQMIDYKALKGDPTDNIPGVPGVGEKTAAKLIREFGTLDALYERLDDVTPEKLRDKLREHHDQVLMGRELSTIVRDLPIEIDLEAARLGDYDRDTVVRLFREYEFRTLIERLPPMAGETAERAGRAAFARSPRAATCPRRASPAARPKGWGPGRAGGADRGRRAAAAPRLRRRRDVLAGTALRRTARGLRPQRTARAAEDLPTALAAAIVDPGRIEVVDAGRHRRAWSPGSPAQPAVGASLLLDDPRPRRGTPLALAVAGADGRVVAAEGEEAAAALRRLVERLGTPLVGHEVKPVLVAQFAEDEGAEPTPVAFDTQIAAYILNAALRSQTIADVVAEQPRPDPAAGRRAATDGPRRPRGALRARGPRSARAAPRRRAAWTACSARSSCRSSRCWPGWRPIGVALDREALALLEREFGAEINRLEQEIYVDVGHEFNLGSPKQLEQILFFELNLPKGKRTKTGYSTDASVLEELRPAHPMIDKLLEWRVYTKLRSTYVEALPTLIAEADGRLHTTFHQAVASTGRLSSSDPNLQNIPIRTELGRRIRRAFVAGEPRHDAARRGLLADRAADPGPRLRRRAPQGRLRAAGRHPPRNGRTRAPQGSRRHHQGRAVDGQDGQLRPRVRDERLRARLAGEHLAPGGAGVHQQLLRRVLAGSATT